MTLLSSLEHGWQLHGSKSASVPLRGNIYADSDDTYKESLGLEEAPVGLLASCILLAVHLFVSLKM